MGNKLVLNNTDIMDNISTTELSNEPGLKTLSSIIWFSVIVIEKIVLLVFVSIYFIIGAVAVILYKIFYKQLYIKLLNIGKREKQASPYYYKWKNHHLILNWEE